MVFLVLFPNDDDDTMIARWWWQKIGLAMEVIGRTTNVVRDVKRRPKAADATAKEYDRIILLSFANTFEGEESSADMRMEK